MITLVSRLLTERPSIRGNSRRGVLPLLSVQAIGHEFPPLWFWCARAVYGSRVFTALGLAVSEKQILPIIENNESRTDGMEPLEATGVRPSQAYYLLEVLPYQS